MISQLKIFDAPCPAPETAAPFAPFSKNYLTGPIPRHFQNQMVTGLTARLTRLSDDEAAALVEFGSVWLDDRPCFDPGRSLANYQNFRINPPAYGPVKFYEADSRRIVYEDADLLVYHKESGRPSQGVPHDGYNNVLSALARLLQGRGDSHKLWLLHRLDADTSGLLLLAKNKEAAGTLGRDFQQGRVGKEYLCVGLGQTPNDDFVIDTPIAKEGRRYVTRPGLKGLAAKTFFAPLKYHELKEETLSETAGLNQVLFRAVPHTGRTHQIRLHLAFAGWPIGGDRFYGLGPVSDTFSRLMLASSRLTFRHPRTGREVTVTLTD